MLFRSNGNFIESPTRQFEPDLISVAYRVATNICMVGEVGVEPTQLESNGFTDRPSSPTLALPYIYYSYIGAGRGG